MLPSPLAAFCRASLASILLVLAVPAAAEEKSPVERLDELENELRALREKLKEKNGEGAPAAEKEPSIPGGARTAFDKVLSRTRLSGYFDLEFTDFRHKNSTFDNHHVVLTISSWIHERIFFNTEIEYEHGGAELGIEQAWLDFLIHDAINFRGGVLLIPFGRLNALHDSDLRDLTLRPIATTLITPTTWSETGVALYGSFFLGGVTLNYQACLTNGLTGDLTVKNGTRDARPSLESDNNSDKSYSARLEAVAWEGKLVIGASAYGGRFDDKGDATMFMYGADLTLAIPLAEPGGWISGPLEIRAEAARFTADPSLDSSGAPTPHRGIGGFVQASFHFFPPFLKETFLGKDFDNPTFTLVALWDAAEIDAPEAAHNNHQRRLSFGLNYRPIEQVAFKVEYIKENSDEIFGNFERNGWAASVVAGF